MAGIIDNRTPNGDLKRPIQLILRHVIVASASVSRPVSPGQDVPCNHVVGLPELPEKSQ